MFDNLSDEACIKRFQETKEEAVFNCLLNRHRIAMRRMIYSILKGSREDMEDVEQEVSLALYKNLASFSFRSSYSTYLYRLCRNKAIDFIRRKEKQRKIFHKTILFNDGKQQETPDEIAEKKTIHDGIMETLFQLPEGERTLIVLKDIEQQSLSDIGEIVHMPLGTVKSRLHRARLHASEILKKKEII